MTGKLIKGLAGLMTLTFITFIFIGCGSLLSAVAAPQGYVVNAKTGVPISGVVVKLTALDGGSTSFISSTDSSGYYTFSGVDYGRYELTASSGDLVFTRQVVDITGLSQTLPNIGGFEAEINSLSIIVFWDRAFKDVDAYLSYPTVEEEIWDDNLYGFYPPLELPRGKLGFEPETVTDAVDTLLIEKDIDNRGDSNQQPGGPETFSIYYIPFTSAPSYVDPDLISEGEGDPSRLPEGSYDYQGAMIYYLDAFNSNSAAGVEQADAMLVSPAGTSTVPAARPVVYVFYTSGTGSTQLGRYMLPQYTTIKSASILRINMFVDYNNDEWYQIVPEIKLADHDEFFDDSFRNTAEDVIVVGGNSR